MKVIIGGQTFDSKEEPIFLVWDSDITRVFTGSQISRMQRKAEPRVYAVYPESMDKEAVKESVQKIVDDEKKIIADKSVQISAKPDDKK